MYFTKQVTVHFSQEDIEDIKIAKAEILDALAIHGEEERFPKGGGWWDWQDVFNDLTDFRYNWLPEEKRSLLENYFISLENSIESLYLESIYWKGFKTWEACFDWLLEAAKQDTYTCELWD